MPDSTNIAISLPETPKGKEFEDLVLAHLQTSGLYTEKRIEKENILELDIVTTDFQETESESKLIEVKSGGWGMKDVFKLKGQMVYLEIKSGALVLKTDEKDLLDAHKAVSKKLGLELICFDSAEKINPLTLKLDDKKLATSDISAWRYSFWIERMMIENLINKCKSNQDALRYKVLREYHQEINRDIFYSQNKAMRIFKLYQTFQKYPRMSARCSHEMLGGNFDDSVTYVHPDVYARTFYKCEYTDIQLSCLFEHRARIAILKNVVEYIQSGTKVSDGLSIDGLLPSSFKTGVEELKKHKYYYKYPLFWQWFLWVLGGFILQDLKEDEYKLLSEKTGIPVDEVPNALKAFDILFPITEGWFFDLKNSNITMLTMFPVPFKGLGAHYRKCHYTKTGEFADLKLKGLYTRNDLIKWNNAACEILG